MSLDETERYIEDIVLECSVHFILRNVHRDPTNPARLTAIVEHTRVSAVVDFEEIVPGETRVRTYAPRQLFRNSGIRSKLPIRKRCSALSLEKACWGAYQSGK